VEVRVLPLPLKFNVMTSLLKFNKSVTDRFTPAEIGDMLVGEKKYALEVEGGNREPTGIFKDEDGDLYVTIHGYKVGRTDLEVEFVVFPQYDNHTIFQARVQI